MLVIYDLKMRILDGLELIKKVKSTNHNIRTILMTAFETSDMFKDHITQGVINGFIQKPVRVNLAFISPTVTNTLDIVFIIFSIHNSILLLHLRRKVTKLSCYIT